MATYYRKIKEKSELLLKDNFSAEYVRGVCEVLATLDSVKGVELKQRTVEIARELEVDKRVIIALYHDHNIRYDVDGNECSLQDMLVPDLDLSSEDIMAIRDLEKDEEYPIDMGLPTVKRLY